MDKLSKKHFAQAKEAGRALNIAAKSMRILSSVAWDDEQKEAFLKDGKMPNPDYAPIDVSEPRRLIAQARESIDCLLYTSPSPRDATLSRMPSSA